MGHEVTITRGPEQWSNGLINHWFACGPFHYRLMQSGWRRDDPEETSIRLCDDGNAAIPNWGDPDRRKWDQHPLRWSRKFDGVITPKAAGEIIACCDDSYQTGYKHGFADAQAEIRKALGIK